MSEGKGQSVMMAPAMESFLGPGNKILGKGPGWCVCRPEKTDVSEVYTRKKGGREWWTRAWKAMRSPQFHSQDWVRGMFKPASNSYLMVS